MTSPTVHGAAFSVYVRAVRLTLAEKAVPYSLAEVDPFAAGGPPAEHLARHPFGKVPAFEHDGFRLYETDAILRYIDEAFDGPPLTPADPKARARMTQIMRVIDNYAYPSLVWGVFVEEVRKPMRGETPDPAGLEQAEALARTTLNALSDLTDGSGFLAGGRLTLADLHAAPMFAYFALAPTGRRLLRAVPDIADWWQEVAARPSLAATRSALETGLTGAP